MADIEEKIVTAFMAYENAKLVNFDRAYVQEALSFIKSVIDEYEKSKVKNKELDEKVEELKKKAAELELKAGFVPKPRLSHEGRVERYLQIIEERKKSGKGVDELVGEFINFFSTLPEDVKEKYRKRIAQLIEINERGNPYLKNAEILLNAAEKFNAGGEKTYKKFSYYIKKAEEEAKSEEEKEKIEELKERAKKIFSQR